MRQYEWLSCRFCVCISVNPLRFLRTYDSENGDFGAFAPGSWFAGSSSMKEPSAARKRTLALHERALRFSNAVNLSCPGHFSNVPSAKVWDHLVRAADGASNNLIEADAASSDADFLSKMGIALREAKESGAALMKIRMAALDHHQQTSKLELESEANQLASIFATIILNMRLRLDRERSQQPPKRRGRN